MIENITELQVKDAIQAFLTAQYDKKTEKEHKQLAKALEDNDVAKIAELNALNACFAVIRWKKLSNFYIDQENEHHSSYSIGISKIYNEDAAI